MKLLENPGQKLKKIIGIFFVLDIVLIVIVALLCIAGLATTYYMSAGMIIIVIVVAAIVFLWSWMSTLFIAAYADMAEQLKRQTEILEKIESKSSGSA